MMRVLAVGVLIAVALPACLHDDRDDDAGLDALVAFAREPSSETWSALPLADDVELGLGHHLRERRVASELRDPAAWEIEAPRFFRGAVGPFSALRLLAGNEDVRYVDGSYPRCASPPAAPQRGLASLRRRSIQPQETESCLQWFAVDVYLTDDGEIAAVTLDLWEP
jgi:hypothetical protein